MALKIKTIPTFVDQFGYMDQNTIFSISEVLFNHKQQNISIVWEITPSNWTEGIERKTMTQIIPLPENDQQASGMILAISDMLHQLSDGIPFIPSMTGKLSFSDLNSVTSDVDN